MNYYKNLNPEIKEYFHILSPTIPEWLWDYVNTEEMQRIGKISMNCGADYTNLFQVKYFYSNLAHSIGVALIIWNFTKDKKQTLAGLFHDIATPTFKHCIDFMNGDYLTQESTEDRTRAIIENSTEIMELLKRDGITIEEVEDYKIYPIADNNTPRLASDRFEYNFSAGLTLFPIWNLEEIKEVYSHITILKNEDGKDELGFDDLKAAEFYIHKVSKLWPIWISDKDRTMMQFYADACKMMQEQGELTIDDLYKYSEKEIIDRILHSKNKKLIKAFKKFMSLTEVSFHSSFIPDLYCVNVPGKRRYIVPLVKDKDKTLRVTSCSEQTKKEIDEYLAIHQHSFTSFDIPMPSVTQKHLIKK